jgi:hypothetical protein
MELTGVYWQPVSHLLEGRFEFLLVNVQHIRQVPGRKTDVKESGAVEVHNVRAEWQVRLGEPLLTSRELHQRYLARCYQAISKSE